MSKAQELKALVKRYGEAVAHSATSSVNSLSRSDPVLKRSMALDAAIDAQQSIIDELSAMVPELRGKCERMRLILADRDAEIERLTKDVERFERLQKDFSSSSLDVKGNHCWVYRRNFTLSGPTLRAAIDKELSEKVEGGV